MRLIPLRADSEDFLHLDALRIIAAFAVVMFHWRASMGYQDVIDALNWMNGWIVFVDLFFVISGFIIAAVYSTRMNTLADFGDFMFKRFARLGPLHYATLALYIAIGVLAGLAGMTLNEPSKYDPACIVPTALFIHAFGTCATLTHNFPSWSISAEMFCYLLFPALVALQRINLWLPGATGVTIAAGLYAMGPAGPLDRPWFEWTFDFGALRALPAFAIGITLFHLRGKLGWLPQPGLLMTLTLGLLAAAPLLHIWQGWQTPLAYLVAIFGVAADARGTTGKTIRAIAPFGQLTYSVYMLQAPMMTVVFTLIFQRILHFSPQMQFAAVLAGFPILFAASYLSFVIFENPIRRRMTGRAGPARGKPIKADATT